MVAGEKKGSWHKVKEGNDSELLVICSQASKSGAIFSWSALANDFRTLVLCQPVAPR